MGLAIFDIDGTLVTGPGTEQRFAASLLANGRLSVRQCGAFARFTVRHGPRLGRHVFKKNKAWLAGLREAEVAEAADHWVREVLPRHWFEPCVARLRAHVTEGDTVVLLSGTPDFIAGAIARLLGVGVAIGSTCASRNGVFLADPPLCHPFGESKREIADDLRVRHGLRTADMVAYGDSLHDLALLQSVGRPVAVRPDAGLTKIARREGWEILGDRRTPLGGIASSPVR